MGHSMELETRGKRARTSSSSSLTSDQLSSLSDGLIHRIMSFLKARQVVQTCVLSSRWRYLWRSVPCLDIDQEEFETAGPNRDKEKEWHNFEYFTDHLLINNIPIALLDTFRLRVTGKCYFDNIQSRQAARWIRHGIKYSTQEPGIQRQGLSSSSWRVKRLHLSNISLDDSFMKHVNSGCQCLEDLELKSCWCTFHKITSDTLNNLILKDCYCSGLSVIASPMLKSLVIDGCRNRDDCLLVITTPAVAYLHLSVEVWLFRGGVLLNRMPSLAKALIHLQDNIQRPKKLSGDRFNLLDSVSNRFNLLDSMSNVRSLYLSDFKAMAISEEFPEFLNLRTLLLEKCDLSDNFQMLGHFLQHSRNLENLTLRHCKFSKNPKKRGRLNKGCLIQLNVRCKNLKLTEVIYRDDDVQMLVDLLSNISGDLPKNNIKLTMVDQDHH
ncbi:hypothetical protein BS78_06G104100 [Paspalum vaginatum]|nr:hypothetical protein BS78_06G104100 [Paspalum vaginatum]KAJ1271113.1 hypothetical protein BS78_06G104100 [Paspalum vaginatum]KAJ1271114.1 hypothetical protein BS78_06G104100 [Paspalum vaginatum]KAJ1271115.1 hypothetical protein BS78_06G104100 [Paspalum vaginatum]